MLLRAGWNDKACHAHTRFERPELNPVESAIRRMENRWADICSEWKNLAEPHRFESVRLVHSKLLQWQQALATHTSTTPSAVQSISNADEITSVKNDTYQALQSDAMMAKSARSLAVLPRTPVTCAPVTSTNTPSEIGAGATMAKSARSLAVLPQTPVTCSPVTSANTAPEIKLVGATSGRITNTGVGHLFDGWCPGGGDDRYTQFRLQMADTQFRLQMVDTQFRLQMADTQFRLQVADLRRNEAQAKADRLESSIFAGCCDLLLVAILHECWAAIPCLIRLGYRPTAINFDLGLGPAAGQSLFKTHYRLKRSPTEMAVIGDSPATHLTSICQEHLLLRACAHGDTSAALAALVELVRIADGNTLNARAIPAQPPHSAQYSHALHLPNVIMGWNTSTLVGRLTLVEAALWPLKLDESDSCCTVSLTTIAARVCRIVDELLERASESGQDLALLDAAHDCYMMQGIASAHFAFVVASLRTDNCLFPEFVRLYAVAARKANDQRHYRGTMPTLVRGLLAAPTLVGPVTRIVTDYAEAAPLAPARSTILNRRLELKHVYDSVAIGGIIVRARVDQRVCTTLPSDGDAASMQLAMQNATRQRYNEARSIFFLGGNPVTADIQCDGKEGVLHVRTAGRYTATWCLCALTPEEQTRTVMTWIRRNDQTVGSANGSNQGRFRCGLGTLDAGDRLTLHTIHTLLRDPNTIVSLPIQYLCLERFPDQLKHVPDQLKHVQDQLKHVPDVHDHWHQLQSL
jgi:hypothetical protein